MDKTKRRKEDNRFFRKYDELILKHGFWNFDTFILKEMGFEIKKEKESNLLGIRKKAFRKFRKMTKQYDFASLPTMRKWFGISGYAKPSREIVYKICLQLGVGVEKAREYLTVGLGEISFQYADYKELIYLYGIENNLTCETCIHMIDEFETHRQFATEDNALSDKEIQEQYQEKKELEPGDFLKWMMMEQTSFVGYTRDVLDVLVQCRSEIVHYMRKEAKERLEDLLSETDYEEWIRNKNYDSLDQREILRRYIRIHQGGKYFKISQNMKDNILELSQIAYSEIESNSKLLSEIFSSNKTKEENIRRIGYMTSKRLSDLFNLAVQKERSMFVTYAYRYLLAKDEVENCPDWIRSEVVDYTREIPELENVKEAKEWLKHFLTEQKRRCIDVHRNDILPLIHYIAQHRYLEKIALKRREYNAASAKKVFVNLANDILEQCGMAALNKSYELDYMLLECFQKDEMYSYSEMLDMTSGRG